MVAYFEDGDFHARIALAGEIAVSTISAIYYHFASKTVQENDYLKPIVREAFIGNKAYFIKKWGIEPVGDVPKMLEVYYKTPFNDPSRDLKDTSPYFDIND
jgi:GT2 family glycosyltransferase